MANKEGLHPINFETFSVFEYYNQYRNLSRIYLFDLLSEFNFISEREGNFCVTFDAITKLGILLKNVNKKYADKLNVFFNKIILNSLIGCAFPIFKYRGKVYNKNGIIKEFNLNDNNIVIELNKFGDELLKQKTIIYNIKTSKNILMVSYDILSELKYVINE